MFESMDCPKRYFQEIGILHDKLFEPGFFKLMIILDLLIYQFNQKIISIT